jgi:hypothetical protein
VILIYIADAVWILALGAMMGASRGAARQIPADARLPLVIGAAGPGWLRLPRSSALYFGPAAGLLVSLVLLITARSNLTEGADAQLLIFGIRVFVPSVWALLHVLWLRRVLVALHREGKLQP